MRADRAPLVADLAVKALTVGLLALALVAPDRDGFAGKAMPARAVGALLAGALGLVLPRARPGWVRVLLGAGCRRGPAGR